MEFNGLNDIDDLLVVSIPFRRAHSGDGAAHRFEHHNLGIKDCYNSGSSVVLFHPIQVV